LDEERRARKIAEERVLTEKKSQEALKTENSLLKVKCDKYKQMMQSVKSLVGVAGL
jgi:hypothetical protein